MMDSALSLECELQEGVHPSLALNTKSPLIGIVNSIWHSVGEQHVVVDGIDEPVNR